MLLSSRQTMWQLLSAWQLEGETCEGTDTAWR